MTTITANDGFRGKVLCIGAGFTCAVIARELAEAGFLVDVVESRNHVGGNCHTERDPRTGIMVHVHGPHIFHTDNDQVWNYVSRFGDFNPYICQVKATTGGRVFSLPINLLTINQFFGKIFNPAEAEAFINGRADNEITEVRSFQDQALRFLGSELYEAFFKGYPIKQWGIHPSELPASVLKRLPVRFNYDDNYFNHRHQGIPADGYTRLIERILDHPRVHVSLGRKMTSQECSEYDHTFTSGPLDAWFNFELGQLGYRTLDFQASWHEGDPFTRITEHKHFTPREKFSETIVFHEYSRFATKEDTPYYPIRLVNETKMLSQYVGLANTQSNISFVGRLGSYKYMDMDVTIAEALVAASEFLDLWQHGKKIPAFFSSPI